MVDIGGPVGRGGLNFSSEGLQSLEAAGKGRMGVTFVLRGEADPTEPGVGEQGDPRGGMGGRGWMLGER